MSLSWMSVKRPIAMCCFIIMLVLLGINAYRKIGIDLLPKFDVPYVQITTNYPGASPEEIEVEVAKRIEDAVASLDGLKHITNVCMENTCATTLEFYLGTDVDLAVHDVREKLNSVANDFPASVEPPSLTKVNINAVPVVTLFLTGDRSLDDLYDYVDDTLSDQFSSLPGVGEVRIHGGNEVQLHIVLNPEKLAAANLTIADIVNKLAANNAKVPAGRIKDHGEEISVTYDAEFRNFEALRELEISKDVGKRVYLGDVADIQLMSKEIRQEGYWNDELGVAIEIVKKSDANAVKVIDAVRKKFDTLVNRGGIPRGMTLHWFKDTGAFVQASVDDAWSSIAMGILLTAVLLFLFLPEPRSTFIIAVTMPVSVVITFAAMNMMGYTFDMMTLISLGCSAGVLVTNSIVVIENIFKKLHAGSDRKSAAADGCGEVINAVAASALTNVVVFVPVALMTSVAGMILAPFAGVMVIATLVSLFVSFTLTPILASLLLSENTRPGVWNRRFFYLWDKGYDRLAGGFDRSMLWTQRRPGVVILAIAIGSVLVCKYVVPHIGVSFMPDNDQSEFSVKLEFPSNYNIDQTRERTLEILAMLRSLPYVNATGTTIGYNNAMTGQVSQGVYLAQVTVRVKPKEERAPLETLMEEVRQELSRFQNLQYTLAIPKTNGGSGAEVTGLIAGPEFAELEKYNRIGSTILKNSGIAKDIDSSVRIGKPRINLLPRRPVLKNLGLDAVPLGTTIAGFFEGVEVGTYKVGSRTFDIRVKMEAPDGLEEAEKLTTGSLAGRPINLDVLTEQERDNVSICVIRQDKERSAWLYANPAAGAVASDVIGVLQKELAPQLPPGYRLTFAGTAEMMEDGVRDFIEVFAIAISLTYLLIAAIMESWSRPFLIMFTVPLGFVGLFLALYLSGTSLSIVGMLGGVMMIGIVVNNAILIMDECAVLSRGGTGTHQAMLSAARSKFRPIVMTSIASVAGMLPMAFGTGLGSEIRSSCGIGVVGGLTLSAILTLYLIPAMYFKFVRDTDLPKPTFGQRILGFFGIRHR
ncbi:efflux RND transporter permease subunit [Victivallis sp. Marseille-Q1083]|uniref:efflux RND transporter permease subunit n=1 Tax=Victivallis sp. Marseille-Q1083 TaxID=2717288 RepID=UPI00158BF980|nr:efflux RND transporter permease subunit [Victivallis sp. Marseille-Q1083]